jgi:aryl-alcohol dehydrogenase-like predicted oxidoreductase
MKYVNLGSSGLKVSQLCFGTMTFGSGFRSVGATSQQDANRLVKRALSAGINFFDTADVYSWGESETALGKALKAAGVDRSKVVIATKVRARMSDDPNDAGLSRGHILDSVERSLQRLQVEYIDLYQVHGWDPNVPLGETMAALNDLVRWGKVRYIGCSNFAAWQLAKANAIAKKHGWARFITYQGYYSLIGRDIEHELVPLCLDQGMGILPWSPLAGGLLTGKYRKGTPKNVRYAGELKGFIPVNPERLGRILSAMDTIAAKRKAPLAAVALAWLRQRPGVTSVIIGARNMGQLEENLKAADLDLTPNETAKLDEASATPLPYPQWMIQSQVTRN